MTTVSVKDAKNRFSELGRLAEQGETVVVTRNCKPAFDIVPHKPQSRLNLEAIAAYKKKHGIESFFGSVADDFDEPLPEDFLLRPLP